MLRIRRRLTFANVVSVLALVIALGGTAEASILITSNSQVAAHTIAGANAPAGDHQNLMAGSVGAKDLHAGAVTPSKLTSDARAHKINFLTTSSADGPWTTVLQLDELTFEAQCLPSVFSFDLRVTSSVNGDLNYGYIDQIDPGSPTPVAGGTGLTSGTPFYFSTMYSVGNAHRFEGEFVYANSSRVISVTFHAVGAANGNLCEVTGTAIPAASS